MTLTQKLRANRAALIEARQNHTGARKTVAAIVDAIGYENAVEIVAAMVNAKGEWDGRISRMNRAWAAEQNAPDRKTLDNMCVWYCDEIHPAHMDEIATAMRNAEKPAEPQEEPAPAEEQAAEESPAETAETPAETAPAFPHIRAELTAQAEQRKAETAEYIRSGKYPTWREAPQDTDRALREHSTARRWEQYTAGEITREKAVEYATARALREIDKSHAAKLARLDRIAEAVPPHEITISTEWKRSATWGHNPHTEITDDSRRYFGTAGGCGYDKHSAAWADALNQIDGVLNALYTAAENALASGARPSTVGLDPGCVTWREILGYGSGYDIAPYFEGGVGVDCHERILKNLGYTRTHYHGTKHTDFYIFERTEETTK